VRHDGWIRRQRKGREVRERVVGSAVETGVGTVGGNCEQLNLGTSIKCADHVAERLGNGSILCRWSWLQGRRGGMLTVE
jgi:hypothetical protein